MAEIWDEEQLIADGFERVHVELDWYDGPRAGMADIDGALHYFLRLDEADKYRVWPASEDAAAMECEQWAIFVAWDLRSASGEVGPDSHPGLGGVDARYDELTRLLEQHRQAPDNALRRIGELRFDAGDHYRPDGPDYWFRWHAVN